MTELPNTVAAQAQLHAAMRRSTDPRWVERQLSPPIIVKPSRIGWLIYPMIGLGMGVVAAVLFLSFCARAAELPPERVWVIWNETANKQAHVHRFTGPTACNTDIGGVARTMPDGSRISCVRLDQRKP